MAVQRIGPLAHAIMARPDPDPALTKKVEAILWAFAYGRKELGDVPQLASQARNDYSHGLAAELGGIQKIAYLTAQEVSAQQIERHGSKVGRVLYYRLLTGRGTRFVRVYLPPDGLVTHQNVEDDPAGASHTALGIPQFG